MIGKTAAAPEPLAGAAELSLGTMIRALLIEDDHKLASLLREFLAQHGVEAVVAEESSQALRELHHIVVCPKMHKE